jgi:prevent-host-death family protein
MSEESVRDLRNDGGRVLDRVEQGEVLVVTRNRRPVAELRPLRGNALPARIILERWKWLPAVDHADLRADIDAVLDMDL